MSGDFIRWKDEVHVTSVVLPAGAAGARAVRMVVETKADYPFEFLAIKSIASKLGIGSPETLRRWVRRSEVDTGHRAGVTTEESERMKALKKRTPNCVERTRS